MASIACLVLIETDDPRILEYEKSTQTVEGTQAMRAAVIANLPKLTRLVAIMPEETSRLIMLAHDHAAKAAGMGADIIRPPRTYVAPADRKN